MKKYLILVLLSLFAAGLLAQAGDELFWAADQSLIIMPTAYTMPQGMHAFTNLELAILQYAYAATNRTHLSAGMVFPFTKDMIKTFTAGVKTSFYKSDQVQAAVIGSFNPHTRAGYGAIVSSFGNPDISMHIMASELYNFKNGENQAVFALGGIKRIGERFSGIMECYVIPQELGDLSENAEDPQFAIVLGTRFKGHKISWDIGIGRALGIDMGDFIGIPALKATFLF